MKREWIESSDNNILHGKAKAMDLRDTEGWLAFRCVHRMVGDTFTRAIGDDDQPKDMTSSKTVGVAGYKRKK